MIIISPKKFERVGLRFNLKATIPISILTDRDGILHPVLYCDFLNATGRSFKGIGENIPIGQECIIGKEAHLDTAISLDYYLPHIQATQGYVIIKLRGWSPESEAYLPIVVDGFERPEGFDPAIREKYRHIEKTIWSYRRDFRTYRSELAKIMESAIEDSSILEDVLSILEQSKETFEPFVETDEDREIRALGEKYREAILWTDFLGAGVGRMDGFEFRVYSNDHDSHFHVVHKGRGIDARFSFPELKLIDYKGKKGKISSREQERVRDYFSEPDNFKKLENEFKRRSS